MPDPSTDGEDPMGAGVAVTSVSTRGLIMSIRGLPFDARARGVSAAEPKLAVGDVAPAPAPLA